MWNIDKYTDIMHMPRDTAEAIRYVVDQILSTSATPWTKVEAEIRKTQERTLARELRETASASQ